MSITITLIICIVTGLMSYQAFNNQQMFHSLKHYPVAEHRNKEYYRMLSSGFIHGSWLHLLINLFVLYQFGLIVENIYTQLFGPLMGKIYFLALYLLSIIAADIPTYFKHANNPSYAAIGASGAVSAVVFVYILFAPWEMLYLYAILPIPAIVGGIAYLAYSSWASKNRNDGIDHSAHFYGAVFGIVFTLIMKPSVAKIFLSKFLAIF